MSGDTVLWTLVKDGEQARAVVQESAVNETELELRFIWNNDDVRETKVSNGAEIAFVAIQKRQELITLGWVDAPGSWGVPGEVIWRREDQSRR